MTVLPTPPTCPRCGAPGRKVSLETPRALLTDAARARLREDPMRMCRTPSCDVVYFSETGDRLFGTADVSVTVFQKSADPYRLVCYCFEHSVHEIEGEVAATGTSKVPDEITAACRAGLEDCVHKNPQGSCCLGNVRKVVRQAQAARGDASPVTPRSPPCCSCGDAEDPTVTEPGAACPTGPRPS